VKQLDDDKGSGTQRSKLKLGASGVIAWRPGDTTAHDALHDFHWACCWKTGRIKNRDMLLQE
jgi:hypothetical protein